MSERRVPEPPDRPVLSPAFWALVAFVASARVVLGASSDWAVLLTATLGLAAALTLAAAAALRSRVPEALSVLVAVAAGVGCAGLACTAELERQGTLEAALATSPVSSWELRVDTDMREGASGWRARCRVSGDGRPAGRAWLVADERLPLGSTLRCVGRFSPNEGDAWGASCRAQGLAGTVRVVSVLSVEPADGPWGVVLRAREAVLRSLDPSSSDERALVAGAVCASTDAMSRRGLDELFSACGVSHLVAVSGGHLVLVSSLVSSLLGRTRLAPLPRAAALVFATGLFVLFCGAPISAVRSWVMSLATELSRLPGRRAHPLTSASVAALTLAALEPGVTGQLSYLLSVSCVCGICMLGGYARYALLVLLPRAPRGRTGLPETIGRGLARAGSAAREALVLTLVSQLVTAPLTCSAFGTLSLVAPLANVVLAPLFSALLVPGLAAAALVGAPAPQRLALACCDAAGGAVMAAVRSLSTLPMACVAVSVDEGAALVALVAGVALLLVVWPRLTRRALAYALVSLGVLGVAAALRGRLLAPACVRILDVGQGDAILVTDGPDSLLVDTGPGDALVAACARSHVTHVDAVVLTHLHDDHTGGLEALRSVASVGRVIVAEGVGLDAGGPPVTTVGVGDVIRVGRFELTVLSPSGPVGGDENEDSIVLSLAYEDAEGRTLSALLAGDAERDVTDPLVSDGRVGDVDLLKVGHHGSAASVSPEAAAVLEPELSVASAGEGNDYGHPDPACVETLERAGSVFLCTMDVGDVCVEPGAEGPIVSCQRGLPG